jgi:hypothetical protein
MGESEALDLAPSRGAVFAPICSNHSKLVVAVIG